MNHYLTVYNKVTHRSVPFYRNKYNEICLNSLLPEDTESNCIVTVTDTYYEYSIDLDQTCKKV
jgi:hypothetical protein